MERVGKRIAAASGLKGCQWEFIVVKDDNMNAFVLPGGKVSRARKGPVFGCVGSVRPHVPVFLAPKFHRPFIGLTEQAARETKVAFEESSRILLFLSFANSAFRVQSNTQEGVFHSARVVGRVFHSRRLNAPLSWRGVLVASPVDG